MTSLDTTPTTAPSTATVPPAAVTPIDPAGLPAVVAGYLAAHLAEDAAAAAAWFTPDGTVVDEGRTHTGIPAIEAWLGAASTQYRYTTTVVGAVRVDADHWLASVHLDGDFPGGVVDLGFRFAIRGERIAALTIAP